MCTQHAPTCRWHLTEQFAECNKTSICKTELLQQWNSLHCHITTWCSFKSFTCLLPNNSFVNMKTMATPPMLKPWISTFCLCYHLNSSPLAADKEAHLCLSQADEVLNNIQHHLHMMSSVIGFGHGQHTASQQLTQKTQALMDIGQVPCKDPSLWCPIHSHL